jgi:DMSO/TMAO reductase YedYZ molybdopterin-dependent catalytic subunit
MMLSMFPPARIIKTQGNFITLSFVMTSMADDYSAEETQFPGLKDDSPVNAAPAPEPVRTDKRVPREMEPFRVPVRALKAQSRRDFLLYGAGAAAAAFGFLWLLPDDTRARLHLKPVAAAGRKARLLDKTLSFDDDVAEALYSPTRAVPTYSLSQAARELRNNYDGQTPDPGYIPDWHMTVAGLASGKVETLTAKNIQALISRCGGRHDQVTRLVCVEGWSMIAGWGGLRFADFLQAYPPMPGAKWARLDSSLNLDSDGNSDPYYVSLDLPTARHPQTLLATHQNNASQQIVPLTVEHGAPLRLIAPMKLGLKNIKAITKITYTVEQPKDYWSDEDRGYSHYDGL